MPLRIRYSAAEFNDYIVLNLYYRNGKLIFADLTITFTSGKMKNKIPYKRQFYFSDGKLQWETRTENEAFKEADIDYSFEYLNREEIFIRKMIYK